MRELKFRAYIAKPVNSVYASDGTPDDSPIMFYQDDQYLGSFLRRANFMAAAKEHDSYAVDKVELLQFTGIRDRNGVEIFEGDLVRIYRKPTTQSEKYWPWESMPAFLVTFIEDGYKIVAQGGGRDWGTPLRLFNRPCEVIGNIYESPELLKGEPA